MSTESHPHWLKLVRDAAPVLDSLIHRLTGEGHAFALLRTEFKFDQANVTVIPDPQDRDLVLGLAVEEFRRAGWGFGSRTDPDDPTRPIMSIQFRHPVTETKLGDKLRPRRQAIHFEIPHPPHELEWTPQVVAWYSKQAADITSAILSQHCAEQTGGIPGHPALKPPQPNGSGPVMTRVSATAPRPLHTKPMKVDEDEEEESDV